MTSRQPGPPGSGTRRWRPPRPPARSRPRRPATRPSHRDGYLTDWDALDGQARQAAWTELAAWVIWLHDRYELSVEERLPHCWGDHPGLIEELSALRAWRLEIWNSPQPSGQAARYWHAEMRQTITAALTFYAPGCRAGHRDAEPAAAELRRRWATGPARLLGAPVPGDDRRFLTGAAMTAHVRGGRAATLSETITGYLRHDQSWWEQAHGGWQQIADPAATALLDHHAQAMARADQAVSRAARTMSARPIDSG
jgi:hypothetical protein